MVSETDKMSDFSFRVMEILFKIADLFYPSVDRRVQGFGLQPGMVVVDYGCGPGRYTTRLARLVGEGGKVYAVDVQPLALKAVEQKIARFGLQNVQAVLAQGYDSGLPDVVADMVCAIDMFFGVKEPTKFLEELKRITKAEGVLVIDDGHQSRQATRRKIHASGCWTIVEESRDHLRCKPMIGNAKVDG